MRNVSLRSVAAAAALAAAAPAAATNGMRMIGFGPVQNSMGGASAAAPLDSIVIVTNPAAMTALDRRLDVSGAAFMPSPKYKSDAGSGNTVSSDRPTDFIPTLGTVYRTSENLSVGVAALGLGGMGVDYPQDLFGSATLTSYVNMRLAPAVAYRLGDRLSVGVAANLSYAQMKYDVLSAAGLQPRDTAGSFGYGATFGLYFKAPENITLAVAYETRNQFQDFEFDIPAHTLNTPAGPQPVPGGKEKLSFDQPDVVTVGASVHPLQTLLVATDVQWIRWSTTNGKGQPRYTTDRFLTGGPAFNMSWSDQLVLKIGAAYDLSKEVQLRAGYNYGSMPLTPSAAFENLVFPAVSKHHVTVGGGYAFGAVAVNAAVLYSPEQSISGSNAAQGIGFYETKMSQLLFDLGVSWKY